MCFVQESSVQDEVNINLLLDVDAVSLVDLQPSIS